MPRRKNLKIHKGYVDVSIGQIHYQRAGEGSWLLLLHQAPTCSEVYGPLIELLAPHFSVVAIDLPGFGMSAQPPHRYTIGDYAQVVVETMDALNMATSHLYGHHTGAAISCEVAACWPHRVDKLIICGPALMDQAERERRMKTIPEFTLTEDGSYLQGMWNDLVGRQQGNDLPLEIKHREMVWRLRAGPAFIDTMVTVYQYDLASRLPLIQAPTLVLVGEHEREAPYVETVVKLMKDARHDIIPGGTIWLEVQKHRDLAKFMLDFLSGRPRL